MAQIQKGTTFSTGDQVNAANLNAHVDSAILLPGAISDQASDVAAPTDTILINKAGSLKQATLASVFDSAGFLKADGTIPLTTGAQLVLGSTQQLSALQATSKGYVDATFLPITGGTLTGNLTLTTAAVVTLSKDPVSALQATTKQYVDYRSASSTIVALPSRIRADGYSAMIVRGSNFLYSWGYCRDGGLGAWQNNSAQTGVFSAFNVSIPSGVTIVDVIRCVGNSICLLSNGWVYTTGNNVSGQLGHGDTTNRYQFTRIEYFVTNSITISSIYLSSARTNETFGVCAAIASNGDLYTWGYGAVGQLGNNSTANKLTPTKITTVSNVVNVVLTDAFTGAAFALTNTGVLYATGYNYTGQLGLGNTTQRNSFIQTLTGVSKIDATSSGLSPNFNGTSIVLKTDGTVVAAGTGAEGALGNGSTANSSTWVTVSSLSSIKDIGITGGLAATAYAVSNSNQLYTWGYNAYGTVGDGTTTNRTTPFQVNTWVDNVSQPPPFIGSNFSVFLSSGSYGYATICVIDSNGLIYTVGYNSYYTFGSNVNNVRFTKIPITLPNPSEKPSSLCMFGIDGAQFMTILTNMGFVYCLGDNTTYGACQLGYSAGAPAYIGTPKFQPIA